MLRSIAFLASKRRHDILWVAAALSAVWFIKRYYGAANADDLRWVLGPTTWLVEVLSDARFVAEAGVGYISRDLNFAIIPSCAGLNFLAVAVLTFVLSLVLPATTPSKKALAFCGSLLLAPLATLVVNALRICIAIELRAHASSFGLSGAELHRLLGIAVYFGALCLIFGLIREVRCRGAGRAAKLAVAIPFGCYIGVTVVIPALNGSAFRPGFALHATWVVAVCAVIAACAWVITHARLSSSHQ